MSRLLMRPIALRSAIVGILVALVSPAALAGSTYTVSNRAGTTPDFARIQDAIDIALPGDLIEVDEGLYSGFEIRGGVTLMLSQGTSIPEPCAIRDVHGEVVVAIAGGNLGQMEVTDCSSTVVFDGTNFSATNFGLALIRAADVRAHKVDVLSWGSSGWGAIVMLDSFLDLSDSEVTVGVGSTGQIGLPALFAFDSFVGATKSYFQGGNGGAGSLTSGLFNGGDGALGVYLDLGTSSRWIDCEVVGGAGGTPFLGGTPGADATSMVVHGGRHATWASNFTGVGSASGISASPGTPVDSTTRYPYLSMPVFSVTSFLDWVDLYSGTGLTATIFDGVPLAPSASVPPTLPPLVAAGAGSPGPPITGNPQRIPLGYPLRRGDLYAIQFSLPGLFGPSYTNSIVYVTR